MSNNHSDTNSVSASSLRQGSTFSYSALNETDSSRDWYHANHDICGFITLALVAFIMTICPWIFFGVLRGLGGISLYGLTTIVHGHPKDTAYLVTVITAFLGWILSELHSRAVAKIVMKRIALKHTTISLISFFVAFKAHKHGDRAILPTMHFIATAIYAGAFTLVAPGFTALLLPAPFNRTVPLTGTELDFASNAIDCIDWFNNNTISNTCDWIQTYNGSWYTDCLEQNQLADVLEAGRGNMLSLLSNNNVSISLTQLGGVNGLHLLGSLRGVLPIGPNGATDFDTVPASSFKDATTAPDLFYDYTLELQGVFNNVMCAYTDDPASIPIKYKTLPRGFWQYNGTCHPGQDILSPANYIVPPSNSSLAFWACKTGGDSYTLYIFGGNDYATGIGNITCSVAPFQPALFPLEYTGKSGVFAVHNNVSLLQNTSTELLTRAIKGLGDTIQESQNMQFNLLAESIMSFGVKFFGLQPHVQNEKYLRLYEAMIQGILDYEATYIRLIYSIKINRSTPSSCIRQVNGTAHIQVFGWFASWTVAVSMIPISIINLSILVSVVIAWRTADENGQKRLPVVDPTDPVTLMLSGDVSGQWLWAGKVPPTNPQATVWNNEVAFGQNKDGIHRFWPRKEVVGP